MTRLGGTVLLLLLLILPTIAGCAGVSRSEHEEGLRAIEQTRRARAAVPEGGELGCEYYRGSRNRHQGSAKESIPWFSTNTRDWPPHTSTPQKPGAVLANDVPKLEFDAIPLEDVVQFMRDVSGTTIHVDWEAMKPISVERTMPVTTVVPQGTFKEALVGVLRAVDKQERIILIVGNEQITITLRKQEPNKTQEGEQK